MKTKFYHFSQNNSGGHFDFDKEKGITHHIIIEAGSCKEANEIAVTKLDLYWDGAVNGGPDCPCCGDRWYPVDEWGASKKPELYGEPVKKIMDEENRIHRWMEPGEEVVVHYLNGKRKWY